MTDRLSVALFCIAAFLLTLAVLAHGLPVKASDRSARVPVIRKIYRTTVIETIKGGSGPGGTSVSQAVSSSGSTAIAAAPVTRTS